MKREEMIWVASYAIGKFLDYESLKYCDYMYGKENQADEVWEFVEECKEIGEAEFNRKYLDEGFKLYS